MSASFAWRNTGYTLVVMAAAMVWTAAMLASGGDRNRHRVEMAALVLFSFGLGLIIGNWP